ncbi:MAG TPA: nuclear transport factor 2 family protein [Acidimicrobiales bacterium]|nr:nuclear transport factor 2 family protein [Acidimicrobiales bacterium]
MTPDDLVEIEQIKRLKHRYCRCLDQKRFEELAELFVDDATASYGGGARELSGRAAIAEWVGSVMASTSMLTIHQVSQPEIDLVGPTEATGSWALQDVVVLSDAGFTIRGASYYDDRYVKVDDRWLIRHTGYKRIYETLAPLDPGSKLTASWWGTDGRSSIA